MGRGARTFLIVTGAIPLLGLLNRPPEFVTLIYTVFVAALLCRDRVQEWAARIAVPAWAKLWIGMVLAGSLAEVFAWAGHYAARTPEPALLHPQLIPDLILGFGLYSGWAIAWIVVTRWAGFTLLGAVVTAGLFGISFEQMGVALVRMIDAFAANPLLGLLMAALLFAVYGSVVGLACLPVEREFLPRKAYLNWARYPVAFLLMFLLMAAFTALASLGASAVGMMPPKQPIATHPFW